jgi:nucleotide-binding universal stress UspA family protein
VRRTIAAGFGGTGGLQALGWATEEAEQTGADLVIVHACPSGTPLDVPLGTPTPARVALIDPPLAQKAAAVCARLGGHRVTLKIRGHDVSLALVDASWTADLLVVGTGSTGLTIRRTLRHAHCPVVVVRPIRQGRGAPFAGHVVVGVDGSDAGRAALEFAFGYAAEHHLPVAAAHVSAHSDDDYFYDDVTLSTHFAIEPAALRLLGSEIEPWVLKYPRVRVRRAVLSGTVADGLLRAGRGAHLLVVGHKRRGVVGRARTGDVPLAVAGQAGCPVAVVPLEALEGALP